MGPPHRPLRHALAVPAASLAILGGRIPALDSLAGLVLLGGLVVAVSVLAGRLGAARARAEAARRRLDAVLDGVGEGVVATDGAGRVTFLNEAAARLAGWDRAEAIGRPIAEVLDLRDEATGGPVPIPGPSGGHPHAPVVLVARDNTSRPVVHHVTPIPDRRDVHDGLVVVVRDLTAARRDAVRNEWLAAVVESPEDIIISETLDGVITTWNRGAQRIFGYTAAEMVGRSITALLPPEAAGDASRILARIAAGHRVENHRTQRRRKDGAIIDVSVTVSPIRDHGGAVVGASKIGRDITREMRIEAERVAAERRKDEFLAMLAHELRNPVAAIAAAAAVMRPPATAEDLGWAVGVIDHQVDHLGNLMTDLLDVSRISRGQVKLRRETVDAAPILSAALESIRPRAAHRGHTLSLDLDGGPLWVDADPTRLEQIIVNLLTNAAKYTPDGGQITVAARRAAEGSSVVIRVIDNGLGIPADRLPLIFDLFVQGDRTLARSEGGLGLGLTIVRRLVGLHGGIVTAESAGPGQGSTFTVRLPAADPPTPAPPPSREPAEEPGESPRGASHPSSRVLVVDDNEPLARGLARVLRRAGHEVHLAHTGPEALTAAREHGPGFVLLDIGLPGMDGYEVARRLKREPGCAGATLIAVSGYGQPEDLRRSREAGFDLHLVKPVDLDALAGLLRPGPTTPTEDA